MEPRIINLTYKSGYTYHIQFDDGTNGSLDFQPFLFGDAFTLIKDKTYFKKAYVNQTTGTITWPNGIDISPETIFLSLQQM